MRLQIPFALHLIISLSSSGQTQDSTEILKRKLILTKEENKQWFESLKQLPIQQKLTYVIERLNLDTSIFVREPGDRIKLNPKFEATKFQGCCKPLILVSGQLINFYFDDEASYEKMKKRLSSFKEVINKCKIDGIEILEKQKAQALFGPEGESGAIIINITDKKSIKLLKKQSKLL
mgnify:CR=1 FL=1